MDIHPIAHFRSPLGSKFGIPRQSGLVDELQGEIVFLPPYRHIEAVRGLEAFDFLWLIWEFSANRPAGARAGSSPGDFPADECRPGGATPSLTVRPPRLGGNQRMGVFATRSPFRPNALGLSCVRLEGVEEHPQLGPVIHVRGADLMDGTPIYDIKPYISYADSHPEARSGFVDQTEWHELTVVMSEDLSALFTPEKRAALRKLLALDPRPRYHNDSARTYGLSFAGHDVRFRVEGDVLTVVNVVTTPKHPNA